MIDAGLRLAKDVGVEKLTMRALAAELGVSTMAAYYHVKSRDALLLRLGDEIMRTISPPPPESGPWDDRLWLYTQEVSEALAQYPGLGYFLMVNEVTPEGRRYIDRCMEIIAEGGFDAEQTRQVFVAFYTYMWGLSLFQAVRTRRLAKGSKPARSARSRRMPSIHELASGQYHEAGYRALVLGLQQTLLDR